MHTRCKMVFTILIACLALSSMRHAMLGQETGADLRRMRNASEAEQTAWIQAHLRAGMPPSEIFGDLTLNKSEVSLSLIEQKIEEVLRSPSPMECFTDKSVDPENFVGRAAVAISEAGNAEALKEASKLIKIDEKRFGGLIEDTLMHARSYRNPFVVAYRGLQIGDPAVESRIAAWAEVQFAEKRPRLRSRGARDPKPVPEFEMHQVRQWWAEAMVDRYGGVPTESQWVADPLVSRLNTALSGSVHNDVLRLALENVEKRSRK